MDKADIIADMEYKEIIGDLILIANSAEKYNWKAEQILYALDYIIYDGSIKGKDINEIQNMDWE